MVKETNYTKGEWKVDENWNFPDAQGYTGCAVYAQVNNTQMLICELVHGVDRKNERGTANLIASAPQLYEALKKAMRIIEVEHIGVPYYCRKAIAKAEGK